MTTFIDNETIHITTITDRDMNDVIQMAKESNNFDLFVIITRLIEENTALKIDLIRCKEKNTSKVFELELKAEKKYSENLQSAIGGLQYEISMMNEEVAFLRKNMSDADS